MSIEAVTKALPFTTFIPLKNGGMLFGVVHSTSGNSIAIFHYPLLPYSCRERFLEVAEKWWNEDRPIPIDQYLDKKLRNQVMSSIRIVSLRSIHGDIIGPCFNTDDIYRIRPQRKKFNLIIKKT